MNSSRGIAFSFWGENAPLLRCESLKDTASLAISIAAELNQPEGYCWVYLSEDKSDEQHQLKSSLIPYWVFCTQHGFMIGRGFYEFYVPDGSLHDKPVLIYDYDSYSFLFCDQTHFISKEAAWTVLFNELGLQPPPVAQDAPPGRFIHNGEYMGKHYTKETVGTEYRPQFYN